MYCWRPKNVWIEHQANDPTACLDDGHRNRQAFSGLVYQSRSTRDFLKSKTDLGLRFKGRGEELSLKRLSRITLSTATTQYSQPPALTDNKFYSPTQPIPNNKIFRLFARGLSCRARYSDQEPKRPQPSILIPDFATVLLEILKPPYKTQIH